MCENFCDSLKGANFEEEYAKFFKNKSTVNRRAQYDKFTVEGCAKDCIYYANYGIDKEQYADPLYRTSNSEYGYFPPNHFTVPYSHFPLSQKFTNFASRFGMYRNFSLNTNPDRNYY
ncbi:uncharacterized protein LOC119681480 [Teleopsis dalmanni]|uniref:uncharacterized protein LOC119681480 n=1 Tax=Teleopsis dalmanni TaxID=139649 RepID=UPI0018CD2367|nr:uncharacterized protein LOC119681480 [Teleopsis dalmanni]